jgi:hypothetical protein
MPISLRIDKNRKIITMRKIMNCTYGFLLVFLALNLTSCEILSEILRNIENLPKDDGYSFGKNACYQTSDFICEIEQEVHRLINQQRTANGKSTLENHHFVAHINRQWNSDQHRLGQFELDGLVGKIYQEHQNKFNSYNMTISKGHGCSGSRNVNKDTPKDIAKKIVDNWMRRSTPRTNILANGVTWQATGVFIKDQEYLATQILGSGTVNKATN